MLHLYMYIDTTFAVAKRKRDKNSGLYRISYSYSLSCSALTDRANNYQPNGSRSCSFVSCTVYGPWSRVKVINLNVLPESSCNKLKYSLKTSFMFLSIILKFQAPDINILLGICKKATVFDGPWSASQVSSTIKT